MTRSVHVQARRRGKARTVRVGELRVPSRFIVRVDEPQYPHVELEVEVVAGTPEVIALRCERRQGGPPISGELIRTLPIATFLREGTAKIAVRTIRGGRATLEVQALGGTVRESPEQRRRGARVDDAHLKRVAEVYRQARATAQPPTNAVAAAFDAPRSTAGRWVVEARRRGFLEKATTTRRG